MPLMTSLWSFNTYMYNHYSLSTDTYSVVCTYSVVRTVLYVQCCMYSGVCTVLYVQCCMYSVVCTVVCTVLYVQLYVHVHTKVSSFLRLLVSMKHFVSTFRFVDVFICVLAQYGFVYSRQWVLILLAMSQLLQHRTLGMIGLSEWRCS